MEKIWADFRAADEALMAGEWGAAWGYAALLPFLGREVDGFRPALCRLVGALADGTDSWEDWAHYGAAYVSASTVLERLRALP